MSDLTGYKNYMEKLVENNIEKIWEEKKDPEFCYCNKCKLDVKTHALNHLKPKYVASEKGEIFTKIDVFQNQWEVDVMQAIYKAMEVVKDNPAHDIDVDEK
jgi:competence protein ComFB